MKIFIKKIIIYSYFILCVALIIQTILSQRIRDKTISENNNLEQISNTNFDLVLLGSSRCSEHFDPRFFDSTFKIKSINLGLRGHSEISMAILQLKYYLLRTKPPRFVILNFDPLTSAGSLTNNTNYAIKDEFARYAFLPNKNDSIIVNYFKFNLFEKYIPLYSIFKYRQFRNCVFVKNTNDYTKYGYQIHNTYYTPIPNQDFTNLKKDFFINSQIAQITNSLSQLNELCKKNNIKLLLIQTPVYKTIYNHKIFSKTRKICYSLKIDFIDVNNEFFINNAKNFRNINHLNKYGVWQMNQLLKKDSKMISFFKR